MPKRAAFHVKRIQCHNAGIRYRLSDRRILHAFEFFFHKSLVFPAVNSNGLLGAKDLQGEFSKSKLKGEYIKYESRNLSPSIRDLTEVLEFGKKNTSIDTVVEIWRM
nr:hypothetical transcript [Hymenolepis microstoma]